MIRMRRWLQKNDRTTAGVGIAGTALLTATLVLAGGARLGLAQDAATPAASDPAAVAEATADALRDEVAALSTEVARLAGDEDETLTGRLGGERGGFTVAHGAPVAYVGPDDVVYEFAAGDDPAVAGRVTASFADGRAERLVIVPDRPLDKALDEPDEADWAPETAAAAVTAFLPEDAAYDDGELDLAGAEEATGSSEALAAATAPSEPGACPTAGGAAFTLSVTRPTEETISAVTVELASGGAAGTLAAGELVEGDQGRTRGGASAVANSSLGGVVTVNGLRVEAFNVRPDAEVEGVDPGEGTLFAVELAVENGTERAISYQPGDFVLVDGEGRELSASCGGLEPVIAAGELAPGDSLEGWVTFVLPDDFEPERFVFLAADARVGFDF
jgi:hypothetical protein